MKQTIIVPMEASGTRIDKFIGGLNVVSTRSRALQLIKNSLVKINGNDVKPSNILKGGEIVEIFIPEVSTSELIPMQLDLEILFEDEHLLVLNKPPGLVVHPAAGHEQDTLVNALLGNGIQFSMKFGDQRPGIVHRLDKDTSGVMVIAKSDRILEGLAQQFKNRTIQRHYLSIVLGLVKNDSGEIKSFLARHPTDRKKFASIRGKDNKVIQDLNFNPGYGKWAHTDYNCLAKNNQFCLTYIRLKLHTGRTHQIRIHLSEMGYPILGDYTYGANKKKSLIKNYKIDRLALHAAELGFVHPATKKEMYFYKDWPLDYFAIVNEVFGENK